MLYIVMECVDIGQNKKRKVDYALLGVYCVLHELVLWCAYGCVLMRLYERNYSMVLSCPLQYCGYVLQPGMSAFTHQFVFIHVYLQPRTICAETT